MSEPSAQLDAFIADSCSTDDIDGAVKSWQKNRFCTGDYVSHRIFRACLSGGTGGSEALCV